MSEILIQSNPTSLIDQLLTNEDLSSIELQQAIDKLMKAQKKIQKKENENKKIVSQDEFTSMDLSNDWDNLLEEVPTSEIEVKTVCDSLILSLNNLGKVDIEYIASLSNKSKIEVINQLKGSIFQDPEKWQQCYYKGWQTYDEYLSGNLRKKYQIAKQANDKYNGQFIENLKALKKLLPQSVDYKDIYVTLGSPWIPADIIDEFILHLLGDPYNNPYLNVDYKKKLIEQNKTTHDSKKATWEIPNKSRYYFSIASRKTYGTDRLEALYIIEKTLNMRSIAIYDTSYDPINNKDVKILNKSETTAALEKQQLIIKEFQQWIWQDKKRKERLEKIYEEQYSSIKVRRYDGSFLQFADMSEEITLYPYQKDAVARIIFGDNTLLAHDVGSGKTFVMIAAGQQLKRMKLSKKNMYVVPNNIVGQWQQIFLHLYPNAKLLCVEPKTFTPSKRKEMLTKIRDEDYDGIIIAYSCFSLIPLSKDYQIENLKKQKEAINDMLKNNRFSRSLKRKRDKIDASISALLLEKEKYADAIYFDDLNISRLFVDEAHNFKNIPIETKTTSVLGINATGSKKCQDMLDKVRLIQRNNDGKGVIMATGTPITNSITDAYIMQLYLQPGELAMLDLENFDSWIGMFAQKVTEFEIDVDTNSYRLATRFSKFHNLPELTSLLSSIADFHQLDITNEIPQFDGCIDNLIGKSKQLDNYLQTISKRADRIRQRKVSRKDDNMLKITTDGRKAALDLRLVDKRAKFTYQSKVARCAENVSDIYFKTEKEKRTQLIFCDCSTPKADFNIYSELKRLLISFNIPQDQIAFVHDATSENQRNKLFEKFRKGIIRILIGSTFKLGIGVNIQDNLIALHHIDIPWRPADMTQREGRILRPGNTNKKVYIYRYITEGSFDAYSWQLLETKQRFIAELLSGCLTSRNATDIEGSVLNYGEVKALAIGNPLIKQRVEAANQLTRYLTLQRKQLESKFNLENEFKQLPEKIKNSQNKLNNCQKDLYSYQNWQKQHPLSEDKSEKKLEAEKRKILREEITKALDAHILQSKEKELMNYKGFNIILPSYMTNEKPFIWLEKEGRYYVELANKELGNLVRIDNFLDNLPDYLNKLKIALTELETRQKDIQEELAKNENYGDKIEYYKNKVEQLDKKLEEDKK